MYRFLRSPKWIAAHVGLALLVAILCTLGAWQVRRLGEKQRYNAAITAHLALPEVMLDSLSAARPEDLAYRRVVARGTYDTAREVIVLSRSRDGVSGQDVLTPFLPEHGHAILVNRGWVPLDMNTVPVTQAAPPPAALQVRGVLFPAQMRGRFGPKHARTGTLTEVFRVDIPRLAQQLPYVIEPVYLLLQDQQPGQAALPKMEAIPSLNEGPHRGYAAQWFAFALIAVITYGARIRMVARSRAAKLAMKRS